MAERCFFASFPLNNATFSAQLQLVSQKSITFAPVTSKSELTWQHLSDPRLCQRHSSTKPRGMDSPLSSSYNRRRITNNKRKRIMAIPVTNIPVLTGEVAERFIEQCEYNAQHLRGSEWRGDFEDVYKDLIARSPILQK